MSGKFGGGGSKCTSCGKTSYTAETIHFEKHPYHRKCFKCLECKKKIENTSKAHYDPADKSIIYCGACYNRKGLATKQTKVKWEKKIGSSQGGSGKWGGGGVACTICSKTVFMGEQISFDKKPYHAKCFKCRQCHKKLAAGKAKSFEEETYKELNGLYCEKCWATLQLASKQAKVSQKWKHSSGTSGGSASKFGGGGQKCAHCNKTVYPAEGIKLNEKHYHKKGCIVCSDCGKTFPGIQATFFDGAMKCPVCWKSGEYSRKQTKTTTTQPKSGQPRKVDKRFKALGGGGNKCVNCFKTVYPAETVCFEKHFFHTNCFVCKNCSGKLTPGSAQYKKHESGDIDVYCVKCFKELGLNRAQVHEIEHKHETEDKTNPDGAQSQEHEPKTNPDGAQSKEHEPKTNPDEEVEDGERPELS